MANKKKRARRSFGGRSQTQKESKKKRKRQESNPASPSLETPSNLDIQIDVTNTVADQFSPETQNEPVSPEFEPNPDSPPNLNMAFVETVNG